MGKDLLGKVSPSWDGCDTWVQRAWPLLTMCIWISVHGCNIGHFQFVVDVFTHPSEVWFHVMQTPGELGMRKGSGKNILLAHKEQGRYREEHFKSDVKIFSFRVSLSQIPPKKYIHLHLGTPDLPESSGKISTTINK